MPQEMPSLTNALLDMKEHLGRVTVIVDEKAANYMRNEWPMNPCLVEKSDDEFHGFGLIFKVSHAD